MKQNTVKVLGFLIGFFCIISTIQPKTKTSFKVTLPQFGEMDYTIKESTGPLTAVVSQPSSIKPFAHSSLPPAMISLKKLELKKLELLTPPEKSEPIPGKVTLTITGEIELFGKTLKASFTMKQKGDNDYDIVMKVPLPRNFTLGQLIPTIAGQSLGHIPLTSSEIIISSFEHVEKFKLGSESLAPTVHPGINVFGAIDHLSLGLLQSAFENSPLNKVAMHDVGIAMSHINSFEQLKKGIPLTDFTGKVDLSKLDIKGLSIPLNSLPCTASLELNKLHMEVPLPSALSLPAFGRIAHGAISIDATIQPIKQTTDVNMVLHGEVAASVPIVGNVKADLDAIFNSKTGRFDLEAVINHPTTLKPFEQTSVPALSDLELSDLSLKSYVSNDKTSLVVAGKTTLLNTAVSAEVQSVKVAGSSQHVLTAVMPPKWTIGKAIPSLASNPINNITFDEFTLVVSPVDYFDKKLNIKILKGINIIGAVKKLNFKALMPKLGASPLQNIVFNNLNLVIQGLHSLQDVKNIVIDFSAQADLSEIDSLRHLGNLSSVPLSGSFGKTGALSMHAPFKAPTGSVDIKISANPLAKTAAEKVSIGVLTRQKLNIPVIGTVEFEVEIDADPKNLELKGAIIQPATIKPFSYISGAPAELQSAEMGHLKIETKLKAGEPKKITVENAKISGVVSILNTPVEALLNPVKNSNGSYDLAVKVSIPPVEPGLPEAMYKPWSAAQAIPSLKGKPLGGIIFKQLTFVFTQFDFKTNIKQFGELLELPMKPFINIFAEVDELNAGLILPQLKSTPLNDVTLTDVAFSIQNVKNMDQLKKEIPSMHISGTGDFSKLQIPNFPVKLDEASVSFDITPKKVAVEVILPKKGIEIANVGTLGNARFMINIDFANGIKSAPTGFDFAVNGKLTIPVLNNISVDATLKLPPRPGIKAGAIPTSFASMLKGIKFTDFVMVALTPPNFNIVQAMPALKKTPLANITFPDMLLSTVPAGLPPLQGPELASVTGALPPTPGINAPTPGAVAPPAVPGAPALPGGLNGPGGLVPGLNMFGQLPKLNFGEFVPQLASTPLAGIEFADIGFELQELPLDALKQLRSGKLIPFIKIKAIADLSNLNMKIPGAPSLSALPIGGQIDKNGTLKFHTTFAAAAGTVDLDIEATPLQKKFKISTSIHQVIPVPAAMGQYFDFKEIEVKVDAAVGDGAAKLSGIVIKPLTIKPLAKIPGVPAQLKDLEIGALQINTKAGVGGATKLSLDNAEISGLMKFPGSDVRVYVTIILDKKADGSGYDIALKVSAPTPKVALDMLQKYAFKKDAGKQIAKLSAPWKISDAIPKMKGMPLGDLVFDDLNIIFTTKDLPATSFPDLKMAMTKGINIIGTIAELDAGLLAPQFKQPPFNGLELTDVNFVVQKVDDVANLATKLPDITLTGKADFSKLKLPQISIETGKFKATVNAKELTFTGQIDKDIKVNPVVKNATLDVVALLGPEGIKKPPTSFDISIGGTAQITVPVINTVAVNVDAQVNFDPKTKKTDIAFEAAVAKPESISIATVIPQLASVAKGVSPELTDLKVASSFIDGVYKMDLFGTVTAFNSSVKTIIQTVKLPSGKPNVTLKLMMPAGWNVKEAIPFLSKLPIGDLVFNKLGIVLTTLPFKDDGLDMLEGVNVLGEIKEIGLGTLVPQLASIQPLGGVKVTDAWFIIQSIGSINALKTGLPQVKFKGKADFSGIPQLKKLGDVSAIPMAMEFAKDGTLSLGGKIDAASGPVKFVIKVNLKTKKFAVSVGLRQKLNPPIIGALEFELNAGADEGSAQLEGKVITPVTIKPFSFVSGVPAELKDLELGNLKIKSKMVKGQGAPTKITVDNAEISGVMRFMNTPVEAMIKLIKKKDGKYGIAVKMSVPPISKGLPPAFYKAWKASDAISALNGKPLGNIVFKQLTVVVTQFPFETEVKRFGQNFDLKMLEYLNLVAEVDQLEMAKIVPQLAGTPLNDISFSDISLVVQNIKDKEQLKKSIPSISIFAKANLSKLTMLPVKVEEIDARIDISQSGVAFSGQIPGAISLNSVGSMSNGSLDFKIDFDPKKKFATSVTGFDFKVAGNISIPALNNLTITGMLQLPPMGAAALPAPGAPGAPSGPALPAGKPLSLPDLLKGIKPSDFAFVSLAPPGFDITQALPILKSSPLANIKFPALFLGGLPTGAAPLSGPSLTALTASLPLPKGASLGGLESLGAGFNFFGEIPSLGFGGLIPQLASTPLGDITFKGIKFSLGDITIEEIKGFTTNKTLPVIKIKGTADLSQLPIKIPGSPSLSNLPFAGMIDKTGEFSMSLDVSSPSGTATISISANPLTKKFAIDVSVHQTIPVPPLMKQYLDFDELEVKVDAAVGGGSAKLSGIVIKPLTIHPLAKIPGVPAQLKDLEIGALQMTTKAAVGGESKISLDNADISGLMKFPGSGVRVYTTILLDKKADGSGYDIALKVSAPPAKVSLDMLQKYAFKKDAAKQVAELSAPWTISKAIPKMKGMPLGELEFKNLNIILTTKDLPATMFPDLQMPMTKGINIVGTISEFEAGLIAPQFKQAPFDGVKLTDVKFVVQKVDDLANLATKLPDITMTGKADFSKLKLPNITVDEGKFKLTIDEKQFKFVGNIPHDIKVNPIVKNATVNVVANLGPQGIKEAPTSFDVSLGGVAQVNVPVVGSVATSVDTQVVVDKAGKTALKFNAHLDKPSTLSIATISPALASVAQGLSPELSDLSVASEMVNGQYKMDLNGTLSAFNLSVKTKVHVETLPSGKPNVSLKLMMPSSFGMKDLLTQIPAVGSLVKGNIIFNKLGIILTTLDYEDKALGLKMLKGVNVLGEIDELSIGALIPELAGVTPINGIVLRHVNFLVNKMTSIKDLKTSLPGIDLSMDVDLSKVPQLAKLGDVSKIPAAGKFLPDGSFTFGGDIAAPSGAVKFTITLNPKEKKFEISMGAHLEIPLPGPAQKVIGADKLVIEVDASADPKSATVSGSIISPAIKPFENLPVPGISDTLKSVALRDPKVTMETSLADIKSKKPFKSARIYGVIEVDGLDVEVTIRIQKDKAGKYQAGAMISVPPVHYKKKPVTLSVQSMFKTLQNVIPVLSSAASAVDPVLSQIGEVDVDQITGTLTQFPFTEDVKRRDKIFKLKMLPYFNIVADINQEVSFGTLLKPLKGTPLDDVSLSNISILLQNIKDKKQFEEKPPKIPTISVYAHGDFSKLSLPLVKIHEADVEFDLSQTMLRVKVDITSSISIEHIGTLHSGKLYIDLDFANGLTKPPTNVGFEIAGTFDLDPPFNLKGMTGILQLTKPLKGSIADFMKGLRPKDFAFIGLPPSNFTMSSMVGMIQGIVPAFKLPPIATSIMKGLPKPNIVLAYTPTPISGPALGKLTGGLKLPAADMAALGSLAAFTPGINFALALPTAGLADFIPSSLNIPSGLTSMLKGIKLKDITLTAKQIPLKKPSATDLTLPEIGFSALSNVSGIPMLPSINNLPLDVLFKDGKMNFEFDLTGHEQSISVPGLDVGKISNPKLVIELALGKKPIGYRVFISFDTTVNILKKISPSAPSFSVNFNLNMTESGLTINGKVLAPPTITPFSSMSLPSTLSDLKTLELSKLGIQGDINLVSPLTSGKKPEVKNLDLILSGHTSLTKPITVSGAAQFKIIETLKPKAHTDVVFSIFPEQIDLQKLVPGLPNIAVNLSGSELIITTVAYTDPNPAIGSLKPGITLYGSYKKVKTLESVSLKALLPFLGSAPFGDVVMTDISILVKDISGEDPPQLDLSGTMDLTKIGSIKLPYVGDVALAKVNGRLTYSKKAGLRIEADLDKTFDVTFNNQNVGNFKNPKVVFTAIPQKADATKFDFDVMLESDGTIKLPLLGNFDVNAQFDFKKDQLQQKFTLKKDVSYRGMHLIKPYILLFEGKQKNGFELHGLTEATSFGSSSKVSFKKATAVNSIFSFMKTSPKKMKGGSKSVHEGGLFVSYSGMLVDASFQPFTDVIELSRIPNVPKEVSNVTITNAELGLHLSKDSQSAYILGDFDFYSEKVRAGFFAVRNYLGKVGVAVMGEFVSKDVNIIHIQNQFTPAPVQKFFNTVVAPKVRNFFNHLPAVDLGFILSNIQYTFHIGASGIGVFPGEDTMETEIDSGFTETGSLNSTQLIRDLAVLGSINFMGKKINIFNPHILSGAMGPSVTYFKHIGAEASLGAISMSFFADDTSFKYNLGDGYSADPGPFIFEFSAEPTLALVLGVDMTIPNQQQPMEIAGKAEVRVDDDDGEQIFMALGGTAEGDIDDAFGIDGLSVGDIAIQGEWDITEDAEENAAEEGGGSATDEVDGPGGTAAGTAASAATDLLPSSFGVTGSIQLGDDPKTAHTGDLAINFNVDDAMDFLYLVRIWGKYDSQQIANSLQYVDKAGQFLGATYDFARSKATAKPRPGLPIIKVPTLPKSQNYKRYAAANKKKAISSIGSSMKATKNGIIKGGVAVEKAVDALANFAKKAGPAFNADVKTFLNALDLYVSNMEFHYAAQDIEIGNLWFDAGFTYQGSAGILGYNGGFKAQINMNGLSADGFLEKMDVLEAIKVTDKYPQLKNQVLITGAGMDGKYGTKDDGPAFNAQLNFGTKPIFVLSGKINIKPLQLEGEGDVTLILSEGYRFKMQGNLLGFGEVTYEGEMGKTDAGNPGYGAKVIFSVTALKRYLELLIDELKVAKFTGDVGAEAAEKALAAIEKTLAPLQTKEAALKKEIAQTKADITKKKNAWKTNTTAAINKAKASIASTKKNIADDVTSIKNLTKQLV
ncbi:hypothetical protein HOM50_01875 [bacterium]|jgi:hypothetical protein|nr:hypothetical protein [bacterium]MBT5015136.1 hypothetical protein [bacterium]